MHMIRRLLRFRISEIHICDISQWTLCSFFVTKYIFFGSSMVQEQDKFSYFPLLSTLNESCPTTHHAGAWGKRRYSSYSFSTSALDGVSRQRPPHPGPALAPGKWPPVPTVQETGWAPEPVWTQRLQEKLFFASAGDRTSNARSQTLYWLSYPAPISKRTLVHWICTGFFRNIFSKFYFIFVREWESLFCPLMRI
jgi:hypothetical protein